MGLNQKESLREKGDERNDPEKKCCAICRTSRTPLWRVGPDGPKTLCNACGIRYRKRRSSEVESVMTRRGGEKKQDRSPEASNLVTVTIDEDEALRESVKMGLMALGNEVLLQRSPSAASPPPPPLSFLGFSISSPVRRQRSRRRGRREVEQAAGLLLALSCGSVSA